MDFSAASNISKAREWMSNRKVWLDEKIGNFSPGNPTAIGAYAVEKDVAPRGLFCDLTGRPVSPMRKGLYVQDGRLVMVR